FDAANAVGGPVIIRLAPIDHGKVPPLTIEHSHTTRDGYGATLTVEDGAAGPLLTGAPDAQQVNIFGVRLDGNAPEQAAERHLLYFAPYSGAARPADRSNVTRVELVNSSGDGLHIGAKRVQVGAMYTSIRDCARYGIYLNGSDGRIVGGAVGLCATDIYVDGWTYFISTVNIYSASAAGAGVRITKNGKYTHLYANFLDNNCGTALHIEGEATDTFSARIALNHFRKNSLTSPGALPEVYIANARDVLLTGNDSSRQDGVSTTSYAIQAESSTQDIYIAGNAWERLAHTVSVYNDITRYMERGSDRLLLRADGAITWGPGGGAASDVNLYRPTTDTLKTDDYFQALRFMVHGSGGAGFFGFEAGQTTDPSAPTGSGARVFTRVVGGKVQLCVRFPTGAVQVISTEP